MERREGRARGVRWYVPARLKLFVCLWHPANIHWDCVIECVVWRIVQLAAQNAVCMCQEHVVWVEDKFGSRFRLRERTAGLGAVAPPGLVVH